MFIEQLVHHQGTLFIGIAEVKNEHHASMNELIAKAGALSEGVAAVQLLNGTMIVDTYHLLVAAQNAVNAWSNDYAQARSLDIEIAVYASGQKQIGRALEIYGVKDGVERIAIAVIAETKEQVMSCVKMLYESIGQPFDRAFPPDDDRFSSIRQYFSITEEEISTLISSEGIDSMQEALSKCVANRVSLVALES